MMKSFIYQPQKEIKEESIKLKVNNSLSQGYLNLQDNHGKNNKKDVTHSLINMSTTRQSIELEDRGIIFGRKISQRTAELSNASKSIRSMKIDCSKGPSKIISVNSLLANQKYDFVQPKNKSIIISEKINDSEVLNSIKTQETSHKQTNIQNNEKIIEGNDKKIIINSGIRAQRQTATFDICTIVLIVFVILLIISIKQNGTKHFVNEFVIPVYHKTLYYGLFQ